MDFYPKNWNNSMEFLNIKKRLPSILYNSQATLIKKFSPLRH